MADSESRTEYKRKWWAANPEKRAGYSKKQNLKRRRQVFEHYGLECACCGESNEEFLTLDHTNDNGAEHRRSIGVPSGSPFYFWIIKNDYPDGFRTLCWNCNSAFHYRGYCPHERTAEC